MNLQLDREITVCFTGHRPSKLAMDFNENSFFVLKIKQQLHNKIINCIENGFKNFISGGAMGVDIWVSEIILSLKEFYQDIKLIHIVPHSEQSRNWPTEWKQRYQRVVENGDELIVTTQKYYRFCELDRNRQMVDLATLLIAVYNGGNGGTKRTIDYARINGVKTEIIEI